jgi:hypothetical protein
MIDTATFRKKLIKAAHADKSVRARLLPVIAKLTDAVQTRQAGFSFAQDKMTVAFLSEHRGPTPMQNVLDDIYRTPIKFRDDDGDIQEDIAMGVIGTATSTPLSSSDEKAGKFQETVCTVTFPRGANVAVLAALNQIGHKRGLKVEQLLGWRPPQTRQRGVAPFGKVAIEKATEDFIEWAMNQEPVSDGDVEHFVKNILHVETSPPVTRREGPRFQKGDEVEIKAEKHTDVNTKPIYHEHDGKVGIVDEVDGMDALVIFKGNPAAIRFPLALKPRGVGIYKFSKPYILEGSAGIEIIYEAGAPPTEDAKVITQVYMGKGRPAERRSANYFTTHVIFASTGGNGYYFRGFPQQRTNIDPAKGFLPRTFNPSKGIVRYVGLMGKRPAQWKEDLKALKEQEAA